MTQSRSSLTTRQLADSLGVSESSVKRWIDDGSISADRTAGGHRRIPLAAAVRFMRRERINPQRPSALSLPVTPALGVVDAQAASAFHEALLRDDVPLALAITMGRYISGADVAAIGDGLIRPALQRIGEMWEHDPEAILVEHRAVDTCKRVLTDLLDWIPPTHNDAPVAISAAGPDDPYALPPLLASLTLQEQGYNTRNLGPCTPFDTLAIAVERYGAVLCSLSVSTPQDRRRHSDWMKLSDYARSTKTTMVIGGRCVQTLPTEFLGRVRACGSMAELSSYAGGLAQGAVARSKHPSATTKRQRRSAK